MKITKICMALTAALWLNTMAVYAQEFKLFIKYFEAATLEIHQSDTGKAGTSKLTGTISLKSENGGEAVQWLNPDEGQYVFLTYKRHSVESGSTVKSYGPFPITYNGISRVIIHKNASEWSRKVLIKGDSVYEVKTKKCYDRDCGKKLHMIREEIFKAIGIPPKKTTD